MCDLKLTFWHNGQDLFISRFDGRLNSVPGGGGGDTWVQFYWVCAAGPTKSLSIYASTLFWTGGFVLLCNWFIEVVVSRTECNARWLWHLINNNILNFLAETILTPYVIEFSYPKNPKMCDPILVTLLKMQPHYSQSSRENATTSSGTSPLASYKGVPPPPGIQWSVAFLGE